MQDRNLKLPTGSPPYSSASIFSDITDEAGEKTQGYDKVMLVSHLCATVFSLETRLCFKRDL